MSGPKCAKHLIQKLVASQLQHRPSIARAIRDYGCKTAVGAEIQSICFGGSSFETRHRMHLAWIEANAPTQLQFRWSFTYWQTSIQAIRVVVPEFTPPYNLAYSNRYFHDI
jgi:hypothetical protein